MRYFFINHTLKQISSFDKKSPVLRQLEIVVTNSQWHLRHEILVEADQEYIYHLVDNLDYVLLR